MKGILAATAPSGSHITSQITAVPILLIYLAVVAIFILVSLKLGSSAWHHVVAALILGMFLPVAIPKAGADLSSFSDPSHRVAADAVLIVVLLAVLIMTVRDKRNSG